MVEILTKAPVPYRGSEIHNLPNGLKIILKEDHTVPVVALQIWVNCGGMNEPGELAGISHALEHMVFKGTPTRSTGEITKTIESNGGVINAATQIENTYYYIDIPSYGAKTALEVLADTLTHPAFPADELERERQVILEEINRRDDNPNSVLWDEFTAHVFRGTPYGKKIIGTKETVSALSRKNLFDFFHAHYVPEKMCLVAVGDFHKKKLWEQIKSLLGPLPPRKAPAEPAFNFNGIKPSSLTVKKPVQLTHLAMGITSVGLLHKDVVKLDILSDILGGGISCRLFQKLREELKIALSVASDYMAYRNKGVFAFFAECFPEKAKDVMAKIIEEIAGLKDIPVTTAELERAKTRIKSSWLHESETFQDRASTLGSFFSSDRMDLLSSYISEVESTTLKDLTRIFREHVAGQDFFITEVVPQ